MMHYLTRLLFEKLLVWMHQSIIKDRFPQESKMNRNRNRSTIEAVQTYRIEKHHVHFFSYIRTEFYKSLYTLMF